MKFVSIVGGRPQFIKASVISKELRKTHTEILVHTGQHYDYNMSELFFKELEIPEPDYNLGISRGSHAQMTGRMMIAIEEVLLKESPDWLLVYGDMNSTLAAALAGAKLHIPICHVESGARTKSMNNPEEINRICTDHVSTLCLACVESAYRELVREGLESRSVVVGDPMYDAFLKHHDVIEKNDVGLVLLSGGTVKVPEKYYYMTCHREENTNDYAITEILKAMESLGEGFLTVYPVHPRNKDRILKLQERQRYQRVIFVEPVGYLESLCLLTNAEGVVTDSGGLQREAFFAEKQCVTIFDYVIHPETMMGNRNQLAKPNAEEIIRKLSVSQNVNKKYTPFGNGDSGCRIVKEIEKATSENCYKLLE